MSAAKRTNRVKLMDLDPLTVGKMRGKHPPHNFIGNGCSCSPDEIGGVSLAEACWFHDFHYTRGGTEKERKIADRNLFYNMRICGAPYFWAQLYYRRVRLWGIGAWHYRNCRPPGLWKRVLLFFSRWVTF